MQESQGGERDTQSETLQGSRMVGESVDHSFDNLHLHYVNETSIVDEIPGLRTCESNLFPGNENCHKIDQNLHDSIEFDNPQSGLNDLSSFSKSNTGRPIINVIIENHNIATWKLIQGQL